MVDIEKLSPYLQELKHGKIEPQDIADSDLERDEKQWIIDEFTKWGDVQVDDFDVSEMGTDPINRSSCGFTWGSENADKVFSPIDAHSYIIFAGTQGMGRTAFTVDFAIKNALRGRRVLYISLEMSKSNILTRIARKHAGITKLQWRDRETITDHQKDRYFARKRYIEGISELEFFGFQEGRTPTKEAIAEVIEAKSPDITIVDNFGLISKAEGDQMAHEESVSRFFMNLAKDSLRPVIMVHHVKKGKDNSDIDAIRGSGKITDDATGVFICKRRIEKDLLPEERAQFLVFEKKDREFGEEGVNAFYFNKGTFDDEFYGERQAGF